MRLRHLAAQHYRNLALVSLDFAGDCTAFVGANAQGKTNLLEAIGLLTALRSFRQSDGRLLVAQGRSEAALFFRLAHERRGTTEVTVRLRPDGKEVTVDGERLTRLGDFIGRFPTVVFSSPDLQLVRGGPGLRRRFLDLALAAVDPAYFEALQRYQRALAGRNALLKDRADGAQLAAFEAPLAAAAAQLVAGRTVGLAALAPLLAAAYARLAPDGAERAALRYIPDLAGTTGEEHAAALAAHRERDLVVRATQRGPHRDDFELLLDNRCARDFGSEGQQRCLALALRLAQATWFRERTGTVPLVLADDVLGELDPERRRRFWSALDPAAQVFATGTVPPEVAATGGWQVFAVSAGTVAALSS